MKLYQVILRSNPPVEVVAESWMRVDGEFLFFRDGQAIPDVFFLEEAVEGITVLDEDHQPVS